MLERELKQRSFRCESGVAEQPDVTPTMAAVTVNDDLDIPNAGVVMISELAVASRAERVIPKRSVNRPLGARLQ